jgi:Fic family protein
MTESKSAQVPFLPPTIDYRKILTSLTLAHDAVGELRGVLMVSKSTDMLIAPFKKREAVSSSAIEGTQATLEEVMQFEALDSQSEKKNPETPEEERKRNDIIEVINYERALNKATRMLRERPIGEVLLKAAHSELLKMGRGQDKDPGNFRRIPVRVGDYYPPNFSEIPDLMSNWAKYLNDKSIEPDPLIRVGVAHYQFEAIHPFKDGNGRIGRLVIPLFLCQEEILTSPVLYISDYFEENKKEYLHLLHKVDTSQAWEEWLSFFLRAVEKQAKITAQKAREVISLYESFKKDKIPLLKSRHAITVLDLLFEQPVVSASNIKLALKVSSNNTAYYMLEKFRKAEILREITSGRREKLYVFEELFRIINR